MGYHGIEITVIMEQGQFFDHAKRRDYDINGFSYRNTGFPKESVVPGALNGNMVPTDLAKRKITQEVLGHFAVFIGSESLEDLCEN